MSRSDQQLEDQLLAYHMGWLDRAATEALERLIESSPELATRSRQLQDALEPLADWNALPTVDDLENQVLQRIRRRTEATVPPFAEAVRFDAVPANRERVLRLPFSLKELLAVAASVALILTVVVPGFAKASALAQRRACAENLMNIGIALARYGHDHDRQLPFTGEAEGNWLPDGNPGVRRLQNSRNRFALLRRGYLNDSARYVCPADREAVVMRFDDISQFDDFPEQRNCSYDSQIMLAGGQQMPEYPRMVMWSDSNPIFDRGADASQRPGERNSVIHRGLSGQNVLRADLSANWTTSPNVGVGNDNIWRIGERLVYAGVELPRLATDSFMVP